MTKLLLSCVSTLFVLLLNCGDVHAALVINRIFVAEGESSPLAGGFGGPGGAAPTAVAGGGNLVDIFNAAADSWESIIDADRTIDIYYTWQTRGGGNLGSALSQTTSGAAAPSRSYIRFDNDTIGGTNRNWFMDSTPTDNSEYLTFTASSQNLGAGEMNSGLNYSNPTGDAIGNFDLFTVALHEIGHALGWVDGLPGWADPLTLRGDLPFANSQIETLLGGHTDPTAHPDSLMAPTASFGSRRLISHLDALGLAQITGDGVIGVPEPSSALAILSIGGVLFLRRSRAA